MESVISWLLHHLVVLIPTAAGPTTMVGAARVLTSGMDQVLAYVSHVAWLFTQILAGEIATAGLIRQTGLRRKNCDFGVTMSQLHDPLLRRLCRQLLSRVQEICDSALLVRTPWLGTRRTLVKHVVAAQEGSQILYKIERHVRRMLVVAVRTS